MIISQTEKAKDLLASWNVAAHEDGTFSHNGTLIHPEGAQPGFDMAKAEELILDVPEEGKLYVGYRTGMVETFFEMAVAKSEEGKDVLYFYIP